MPTLELEQAIRQEAGPLLIAGLDEAGRGAIAGPVVAAAVILPLTQPDKLARLEGVDDSKRITPTRREQLFEVIVKNALAYGIGSASAVEVDQLGIIPANARAMQIAVSHLDPAAEYLLIDGRMKLRKLMLPQQSIIRGDSRSLSIAAASILAKVSRDRHMMALDDQFPQYQFGQHKGYCTPGHVTAIDKHGPCAVHRHSFAPIRRTLL